MWPRQKHDKEFEKNRQNGKSIYDAVLNLMATKGSHVLLTQAMKNACVSFTLGPDFANTETVHQEATLAVISTSFDTSRHSAK
jgi:hypothetical protein